MIEVNKNMSILENELRFDFIRASGPGGQKVNKTSTAVQLRFDILNSKSLDDFEKELLLKNAASKITNDGILIIEAKRFRTQERNRQDAIQRLVAMIKKCTTLKKNRKTTKVPKSVSLKRLEGKKRKSQVKKLRKRVNNVVDN